MVHCNTETNDKNPVQIGFHSKRHHTITKMMTT